MELKSKHIKNLLKWIDDSDYCYLCDNHPSHGHAEDCPFNNHTKKDIFETNLANHEITKTFGHEDSQI